jgi:hypothetical protein
VKDATYNLNGAFKPTMKRFADLDGPDFFPTPPWATHALIENEKFDGEIWECACADGTMSRVREKTGQPVRSSDLYDRGFGDVGVDFQNATSAPCWRPSGASGVSQSRCKVATTSDIVP